MYGFNRQKHLDCHYLRFNDKAASEKYVKKILQTAERNYQILENMKVFLLQEITRKKYLSMELKILVA